MRRHWGFALLTMWCMVSTLNAEDALKLFNQRIVPILKSKNASSCSECHLSGVDLKDYIRENQAETFAALRTGGLIDVDHPEESKLLAFIARKPERPGLIGPEVRQAELEAFRSWIEAAVADPQLLAAQTDTTVGPTLPEEVLRHARQDRVLQSFIDNIWLEVGRCAGCHASDQNADAVKKHGEQMSWIKAGDPAATLRYLRENELIDTTNPEQSLLIAKPTLQVKHGGGQKMLVGDRSYAQFMEFINDFAASAQGKYKTVEELPTPTENVVATTDSWLKITDIPPQFGPLLLRVEAYPADGAGWASEPLASGDRAIAGDRRLWQQHLSLHLERGSELAHRMARLPKNERTIPGGKYLLKFWIATADDFATNQVRTRGQAFEAVITTQWPGGYGRMTVVPFPQRK